ncbi:MAG TPA: universal stress protein [Candidatus Sulfotelmatobacter sp.]|nr:universal stress protein [Candidatus Sulfotelmatobacter sp.]
MNTLTNEKLSERAGAAGLFSDSNTIAVTAPDVNPNAFRMKSILVAVKPSPSSAGVLKYAGWLAFQLGCEITLLHAIPNGCKAAPPAELQAEFKRLTGLGPAQLRAILIRPASLGLSLILEAAKGEHADLVVISDDFYNEHLHFWQKNMLEKLIHHLRCPVVVVGDKSPARDIN